MPQSVVALDVVVDARRVSREIAARVPVVLAQANRQPVGAAGEATYRVTRGGFDVRLTRDDRLAASTPVDVELELCKSFGPVCIVYGRCRPRLQATVSVPALIGPDYSIGKSRAAVDITRSCAIFGTDVSGYLLDAARRETSRLEREVDASMPAPRTYVAAAIRLATLPVAITTTTCIRADPQRIVEQRPRGKGSELTTRLAVLGGVRVEQPCDNATPQPNERPVPPLEVVDTLPEGIAIDVPIRVGWDAVSTDLTRSLAESNASADPVRIIRVRAKPTTRTARPAVALAVTVDGPVCGDAWLVAEPWYDARVARVRLRNVELLSRSDPAVHEIDVAALVKSVESRAHIALPIDIGAAHASIEKLVSMVSAGAPPGVEAAVAVEPARIERVLSDETALVPIARLRGKARLTVR
jgi:hypothetical protein